MLFYDRLNLQCPQCSRRFSDNPSGRKRLDEHIDTHFRINRRLKQGNRGITRSWLIVLRVGEILLRKRKMHIYIFFFFSLNKFNKQMLMYFFLKNYLLYLLGLD